MDGFDFAITTGDAPNDGTEMTIEGHDAEGQRATVVIELTPADIMSLHRTLSHRPGAPRGGQCREEVEQGETFPNLRCILDVGHDADRLHEDAAGAVWA